MAASPNPTPREFDLEPADNVRLANLCGPLDENLRLLENRLNVEIRRRGGNFRVIGAAATAAEDVIHELFNIARSEPVTAERVHLTLSERDSGPAPAHAEPDELTVRVMRGGIRAHGCARDTRADVSRARGCRRA